VSAGNHGQVLAPAARPALQATGEVMRANIEITVRHWLEPWNRDWQVLTSGRKFCSILRPSTAGRFQRSFHLTIAEIQLA
jgi:hypothetical protein